MILLQCQRIALARNLFFDRRNSSITVIDQLAITKYQDPSDLSTDLGYFDLNFKNTAKTTEIDGKYELINIQSLKSTSDLSTQSLSISKLNIIASDAIASDATKMFQFVTVLDQLQTNDATETLTTIREVINNTSYNNSQFCMNIVAIQCTSDCTVHIAGTNQRITAYLSASCNGWLPPWSTVHL